MRLTLPTLVLWAALLPLSLLAQAPSKPAPKPGPAKPAVTAKPTPQAKPTQTTPQQGSALAEAASFDEDGRDLLKYESDAWVEFVNACEAGKADDIAQRLESGELRSNLRNGIRRTLLHQAAIANQPAIVRLLLAQNLDINAIDSLYGYTPLHEAARKGHAEVATILIEAGAKLNARDRNGATALHAAIGNSQLDVARALLAGGADINARDHDGVSPLHYAVSVGDAAAAALLLANKVNVNARTAESWDMPGATTPLHMAASAGDLALVTLLVDGGADVNAADSDGKTPLNMAYDSGSTAVANYLRSKGAKI